MCARQSSAVHAVVQVVERLDMCSVLLLVTLWLWQHTHNWLHHWRRVRSGAAYITCLGCQLRNSAAIFVHLASFAVGAALQWVGLLGTLWQLAACHSVPLLRTPWRLAAWYWVSVIRSPWRVCSGSSFFVHLVPARRW
jgi:hypothetical protein